MPTGGCVYATGLAGLGAATGVAPGVGAGAGATPAAGAVPAAGATGGVNGFPQALQKPKVFAFSFPQFGQNITVPPR